MGRQPPRAMSEKYSAMVTLHKSSLNMVWLWNFRSLIPISNMVSFDSFLWNTVLPFCSGSFLIKHASASAKDSGVRLGVTGVDWLNKNRASFRRKKLLFAICITWAHLRWDWESIMQGTTQTHSSGWSLPWRTCCLNRQDRNREGKETVSKRGCDQGWPYREANSGGRLRC